MNDEECRYVGSSLSTSCRGSADAFARSLQRRFNSSNIGNHDEDTETTSAWYQNGHGRQVEEYAPSPLSPENELPNPLSNGTIANFINPELFSNTKPIEFTSCGLVSENSCNGSDLAERVVNSSEICVDNSSVDDNYETASDLSADENVEALELEASTPDIAINTKLVDVQEEAAEDDQDIPTPKIRRCSSLKSGKTPPGTPGGKKIVRFADALGLDLADVKTFVDEIPKIPTSAYKDLSNLEDDVDDMLSMKPCRNPQSKSVLIPLFTQPGEKFDFMERIRRCNVCSETAVVEDAISSSIRGVVKVRNIDFHKTVFVRYSTDKWRSSVDVQASYVENSCDGYSDKFTFLIYANMLRFGDKSEFAVCFSAKGNEHWDNNNGANYVFECISTQAVNSAPSVAVPVWGNDSWGAAFY